ncbi:glycosyl hydrolase family 18 protein [Heyndrickxia sp. NPDC080065]|uniref:glycosyl hydrolase family 18 protein n=1 Tax=Heyndrickxia sp. NPDC080065 TaxID=3390568 RepID=UPI003CFE2D4D
MPTIEVKSNTNRSKKIMLGIVLLFLFVTISLLVYLYPFASTENEKYVSKEYSILLNGKIQGNAVLEGNKLFVPLDVIKKGIDDSIFVETNSVIFTTNHRVIQFPIDKNGYFINQLPEKTTYPIVKNMNNQLYIDLNTLKLIYSIQYHVTKNEKIVWIEKNQDSYYQGNITNKNARQAFLRLRTKPNLQSPYVVDVHSGENIRIEKIVDDYYYVRTKEGLGGFIKKGYVNKKQKMLVSTTTHQEKTKLPMIREPIHLTWEAIYTKTPDPANLPKMPGVNVVSPTWFKLKNGKGEVTNLASESYVKWAKKNGYQVWALFSNSFDPDLTKEAFSHYETRKKIINQLLTYMKTYQLDGLNIDIENVSPEDGPLVTQFVREASAYLHKAGKFVSMDITFIAKGNWSEFYERDKLATVVDYLIVMAYDEHWGNSPTSGSVASLPWVKNNLEQLLNEVPSNKLILGVPFYTRLWKEEVKDGKTLVSSQTLSMEQAKAWIKEKNLKTTEDAESGQNYVEYSDPKTDTVYKMWLEDERSLRKRAELAAHYKLAGVASWARYFGDQSAWLALQTSLSAFNK